MGCQILFCNPVLALLNNVFAPMVGAKMRYYFNKSMFFY